jgi:hypothetical protein
MKNLLATILGWIVISIIEIAMTIVIVGLSALLISVVSFIVLQVLDVDITYLKCLYFGIIIAVIMEILKRLSFSKDKK